VLTCDPGTFSGAPAPTLTFQWLRDGQPIGGATGAQYSVIADDAAQTLACQVFASNAGGNTTATSAGVAVAGLAPANTAPSSVGGTPAVGQVLTCAPGAFSGAPAPAITFAWLRDGQPISGATQPTYTVTTADQGHALACRVTATNAGGSASSISVVLNVPAAPAAKPAPTPVQILLQSTPSQVATAFGLPSARKCLSRRNFAIRVKAPKGVKIKTARVLVNGRAVKVRRSGSIYTARVDLRGLPKGVFTVKIRITISKGRRVDGQRRYRTCLPKSRR